ncbi:hypothetical protein BLAT2472_20541 [Burkholderia latens]
MPEPIRRYGARPKRVNRLGGMRSCTRFAAERHVGRVTVDERHARQLPGPIGGRTHPIGSRGPTESPQCDEVADAAGPIDAVCPLHSHIELQRAGMPALLRDVASVGLASAATPVADLAAFDLSIDARDMWIGRRGAPCRGFRFRGGTDA